MQWPVRKLIYIYSLLTFTLHKDNGRCSEINKNLKFLLCAISFMIFFHKPICQIMLSVRKEWCRFIIVANQTMAIFSINIILKTYCVWSKVPGFLRETGLKEVVLLEWKIPNYNPHFSSSDSSHLQLDFLSICHKTFQNSRIWRFPTIIVT